MQAPAGSGKTEILIQRLLKLLAVCQTPEEVLAITFTRKAANEMKARVFSALQDAEQGASQQPANLGTLEQERSALAAIVIQRSNELGWNLTSNPDRLKIQTFDSFCGYLTSRLPVLSTLGSNIRIAEDPTDSYEYAVRATLAKLEDGSKLGDDLAALLGLLDADINRLQGMLTELLGKRDQWLPYMARVKASPESERKLLLIGIEALVSPALLECARLIAGSASELLDLFNYSRRMKLVLSGIPGNKAEQLEALPPPDISGPPVWKEFQSLLLAGSGTWRKRVEKRDGFPASDPSGDYSDQECKDYKTRLLALIDSVRSNEGLLPALQYLKLLPNPVDESNNWLELEALMRILAHVAAELTLAFRASGTVDFLGVAEFAQKALGTETDPTDLSLAMDYRIQHILVDEFQDTSHIQLQLLTVLTGGWAPDDGRTLFLVGDPMQSCYGFRNADVGIYLQVQAHGLGNLKPENLVLRSNFRSAKPLVDWVSRVFGASFPARADISRGAVPFTPSAATREGDEPDSVIVNFLVKDKGAESDLAAAQARLIADRIELLQRQDQDCSIAVLVRSRSHLAGIIGELRNRGISWIANDIDKLDSMQCIRDLCSLGRALTSPTDRIAWYSVLRAPWCGLTMQDILNLHKLSQQSGVPAYLLQTDPALFPVEAREQLLRVKKICSLADQQFGRIPIVALLRHCWRILVPDKSVLSAAETNGIDMLFDFLSSHSRQGLIDDWNQVETVLGETFLPAAKQQGRNSKGELHLLTMHKAKGLEYDHVILPDLAKRSRVSNRPLFHWHRKLDKNGNAWPLLALAPGNRHNSPNLLYEFLHHEQKLRQQHESERLLYIAATRARKSLSLYAELQRKEGDLILPADNTLLARILEEVIDEAKIHECDQATGENGSPSQAAPVLRLRKYPSPASDPGASGQADTDPMDSEFLTPDSPLFEQRLAGNTVHQLLESYSRHLERKKKAWDIALARGFAENRLRPFIPDDSLRETMLTQVMTDFQQTITDPATAWVFDPELKQRRPEQRILSPGVGNPATSVIDLTFIDAEGSRWIIDFKTATPGTGQAEADFLQSQAKKFMPQLQRYHGLYRRMEPDIRHRCGLLFTGIPTLFEVNIETSAWT